ncbi:MAG: PIG-L deacetylase family protein [Thermoguttaceae bacterium]
MNKNVLVVAAHPDDEVLGCGGTIPLLVNAGWKVWTLILGQGKTSRGSSTTTQEIEELKTEMYHANKLLGVSEVFVKDFPDNKFDTVPLLDIVIEIEKVKNKIKPQMVFTHHFGDMNIDHQITHQAVLTATRPIVGEIVKRIYTFQIPSSTEWNAFNRSTVFVSNLFIDIDATIDIKVNAMACYKSELKPYPHPRSLQHIHELARVQGTQVGLSYCEPFALIRDIRYNDDPLM